MWQYEAPLRDMRYVIEDVLGLPEQWAAVPAFAKDLARVVTARDYGDALQSMSS